MKIFWHLINNSSYILSFFYDNKEYVFVTLQFFSNVNHIASIINAEYLNMKYKNQLILLIFM